MEKKKEEKNVVSCLKNSRAIVRFIRKPDGFVTNPKNPQYGGLSTGAKITLTVPVLRNGAFKQVLTDDEKEFLEEYLGMDQDSLSLYKKTDNFWRNFNVTLGKEDTFFNLADPIDYIRYKVVLSNSNLVAPSLTDQQSRKIGTWKFVLINEGEELAMRKTKLTAKSEAYKLLGSIESDKPKVRTLAQLLLSKPISGSTELTQMVIWLEDRIEHDAREFLSYVKDPFLDTKIMIYDGIEFGILRRTGNIYTMADGTPLAENGTEPTLANCVKYLNAPKNQPLYLKLQSLVKTARE